MKKYYSNLITILISCILIACTVFFTAYDGFEGKVVPVNEEISAKVSAESGIVMNILNTKKILENNKSQSKGSKSIPTRTRTAPPTTTTTVKESTNADASATSAEQQNVENITNAKAPDDESKNVEYIKDPNYKSKYYIVVYTGSQSVVVYGKDKNGAYNVKVKAFTVSTGKSSTPTRKGLYKIRAKYRWRMLMGPCWGQWCSSISSSYLFHSVPYDKKSPNTLYNASYNNLGKAVSHGCIRMCVRDVKWIYDNCPIGTQVHVVWASGPKGDSVPKRKSGSKYSGWDPSDKWSEGNPYFSNESTTSLLTTTTKNTTASKDTSASTTTTTTASAKKSTTTTTAPPVSSTQPADESSIDQEDVPVG